MGWFSKEMWKVGNKWWDIFNCVNDIKEKVKYVDEIKSKWYDLYPYSKGKLSGTLKIEIMQTERDKGSV